MSKFIKLTVIYGPKEDTEPLWMNVNKIIRVREYAAGAWVYLDGDTAFSVAESPAEILELVKVNKEAELLALIDSIYDELTNREVNGNYEISLETFNKIKSVVDGIK